MKRKIAVYACLVAACAVVASWGFAQEGAKKTEPTEIEFGWRFEVQSADGKVLREGPVMMDLPAPGKKIDAVAMHFSLPAISDLATTGTKVLIKSPNMSALMQQEAKIRDDVTKRQADMRSLASAIDSYLVDNNNNIPAAIKDDAAIRQRVSRTLSDMRSLNISIESYYIDNNAYPAWNTGTSSINNLQQPSFRNPVKGMMTLTTPVAYMTGYPSDPFGEAKKTFNFYSDKDGWVLWSPGPDGKVDLTTESIKQLYQFKGNWMESRPEIVNYTYDSTNGTVSGGDIIANKPTKSGDMFQVH